MTEAKDLEREKGCTFNVTYFNKYKTYKLLYTIIGISLTLHPPHSPFSFWVSCLLPPISSQRSAPLSPLDLINHHPSHRRKWAVRG